MRSLKNACAVILLMAIPGACGEGGTDPPIPTSVVVTAPATARAGEVVQLSAEVRDEQGHVMPSAPITWRSSEETLATVDPQGRMTTRSVGRVTVRAQAGAAQGSAEVAIEPRLRLVLSADTLILTVIGDTREITGTVNGATIPVTLTPISESRWHHDRAVLVVEGARVRAFGAGVVLMLAGAGSDVSPDTLRVHVVPARPYVHAIASAGPVGPGTPLVVRGYRLERLPMDSFPVGGSTPTVLARDSASATLGLPSLPSSQCVGGHARLRVGGADLLADSLTFRRARDGEISLAPGEALRLTKAQAECIRVAPGGYALAFYDAQFARAATTLPPYSKTGDVTVSVRDRSSPAPAPSARTLRVAGSTAPAIHHVGQTDGRWWDQTQRWRVGDTIRITAEGRTPNGVVVVAAGPARRVLAVPVGRESEVPSSLVESVRAATAAVDSIMWPRMERIFGVSPGAANGQYPTVILPYGDNQATGGFADARHSEILLGLRAFERPEAAYWAIAHETAHSFHISHLFGLQTAGIEPPHMELWSTEGLADFAGYRVVQERFGYPLSANQDPFRMQGLHPLYAASGQIERGYHHAASWLWDLTTRVDQSTHLTWEQAHDAVLLAAAHNRWGCTAALECARHEGVYDVARRLLGAAWDPVESVLTHTLSGAADDLTESRTYQKPHVARHALAYREPLARVPGYSGTASSRAIHVGSSEYFELQASLAAAYGATGTGGDVEWMIIRLR